MTMILCFDWDRHPQTSLLQIVIALSLMLSLLAIAAAHECECISASVVRTIAQYYAEGVSTWAMRMNLIPLLSLPSCVAQPSTDIHLTSRASCFQPRRSLFKTLGHA